MRLLLDTHILLWAAQDSPRLSPAARALMAEPDAILLFSAASLWEIAIKSGLGRPDFRVDADVLLRRLLDNGYEELSVSGKHAAATARLAAIHKDPFDRLLIAQALTDGLTLLTADALLASYGSPVSLV